MTHATQAQALPPVAAKRPVASTHHGITITDDYAWLRDPGYPEVTDAQVLAHVEAENAYFEAQMAPHQPLVDRLFAEMRARIKEDDATVPYKDGAWEYWSEFEQGGQYRKVYRRRLDANGLASGERQLILDGPALAEGHDYFSLGDMSVSESGRLLAYSLDTTGGEYYDVRVVDLETGEYLPDTIERTNSALIWAAGDTMLVYGRANDQWRVDRVLVHRLGTQASEDVEIYHEPQLGFTASPGMSSNREWLILSAGDNETSEVRLLPIGDPLGEPLMVRPREKGVEYDVDLNGETIYVLANDTHVNFRLATAPLAAPGEWTTLIAGSDEFYITGFDLFEGFYVVDGRLAGLDRIEVRYYDDPARIETIEFPEASFTAGLGSNAEWATDTLRLGYQSMITPDTVYDYDVASRRLTVRKVQEIPSGFDPSLYAVDRVEIAARDGAKVPVSVVYRKDRSINDGDGPGPLHLYAYGAYGYAVPPGFSTSRLSLVDREFAYAIAHIRGGDDLGREWYLGGKLAARTNTFNDFVDVARGLIDMGYTQAGRISASGGSAGGELMGAAVNQAPELWGAIVAHVPFVDVLNTMLDESLPLTPGEWPEWGNPLEDKAAFEHIASYSPYDNVRAQGYPPMLVTAGLNDPRVTYWEPAKWVARLRELKTDDNVLLLKTNMGAGHGGKSGRWEGLRETAEEVAFVLWQLGVEA
ncbi:prolyl oligopeptidase family serine peptidase [Erythrobacter arachoides]|uniref:Prolyl oligopeptidase family serine peptidase n=1 Tax=Aurantiacibacter arachoides TaxID=1850444 RepID=A0A844ZXW0_9SPHN|nr:S9 family peptidase [Aurantiacibacter arachoides]MXO92030.1 prolyl oligopeptidase family serine peptidase [Aurantiacibacter arachoides]GGD60317.1 peptidase S9 [Aurantiacibacter arachoides]